MIWDILFLFRCKANKVLLQSCFTHGYEKQVFIFISIFNSSLHRIWYGQKYQRSTNSLSQFLVSTTWINSCSFLVSVLKYCIWNVTCNRCEQFLPSFVRTMQQVIGNTRVIKQTSHNTNLTSTYIHHTIDILLQLADCQ